MHIWSRERLASELNIPLKKLTYLLYKKGINNCYTSFEIPKKNHEVRSINAPDDELKEIQRKLAELLSKELIKLRKTNNISHGFEKEKGIITNAKIHRNKRFILNIDLENFFDSFHFGRVRGYFHRNKHFNLDIEMATILAQLTCYQGSLPQGAPTSPVISNLICQILDWRILSVAKKFKLDYTRYADDLTFSTNDKNFLSHKDKFILELTALIENSGFKVNDKKTRLQYRDSKQTVTGLVVNKKINVDVLFFKQTRAMAHSLYTTNSFLIDGLEGTIPQLEGRFSFINQIDMYDNRNFAEKKRSIYTLNKREREYQRFLFYKHFINCQHPLIITEGKTDVRYLKAALKSLYTRYPSLVEKAGDGQFKFKISFFKRTSKMKFFFGVTEDGADTLGRIYSFYAGREMKGYRPQSYNDMFNKLNTIRRNPVMFLFDNELIPRKKDEKPLRKFSGYLDLGEDEKNSFKSTLKVRLLPTGNFYLVTNPLASGKDESEIEDLFEASVLAVEIEGRTFDRKVQKGDEKHFGKEVFSKYVEENFSTIDFAKFVPILDNINAIVYEYKKE